MNISRIHEEIDKAFPEHLRRAQEFLRFPSLHDNVVGLKKSAEWIRSYSEEIGAKVRFVGNPDVPIVFASLNTSSTKTLLVYGMYDVHSVKAQTWSTPPFAANIKTLEGLGPCIIARGACNSKGPLVAFLNAVSAIISVGELPINLLLTIEGEEEIGSPSLADFFQDDKDALRADAGFEPFWSDYGSGSDGPMLALGTKGIIVLDIICRGGNWGGPTKFSVHSSAGGWLSSPTWRLNRALSTLVDVDEEIRIEGFGEEIIPPNSEEEDFLRSLGNVLDEQQILDQVGARTFKYSLHGYSLLRKLLYSPSINIAMLTHLDSDEIPNEVRARLVVRTVPKMTINHTVERIRLHLDRHGYKDIDLAISAAYPWSKTKFQDSVVQSMVATYRYHKFEPKIWPLMPSATPYYLFSDILSIPYTMGGLGRAGRSHSADEYATVDGLKLLEKSIATFLSIFSES